MKIRAKTLLPVAAASIAGILSAGADPIPVPNAGFEERETFDPFPESTDKYNQWGKESWRHFEVDNNGGPLRIWNPGDPGNAAHLTAQGAIDVGFGGNAPEGNYVVLVRSRYNDDEFHDPPQVRDFEAAVQLLTNTFDPTLGYTLTAKVGRPPGSANYTPNWFGYAVQLAVGGTEVSGATYAGRVEGGTVIAEDYNTQAVAADEFVTSTVVYVPDPAHADLAGQPLQIRLCALENPSNHSETGWVAFDDVTLETGIPVIETIDLRISPAISPATGFDLTWESKEDMLYNVRSGTDLAADLSTWNLVEGDIPATPPFNMKNVTASGASLYYRVEQFPPPPPPPLLSVDFESDNGGFTMVDHSTGAGTVWEYGDPDSSGEGGTVTTGKGGSTNCWGTAIGSPGIYATGTDTSLISPVIDLTEVAGANLSFAQAVDILNLDTFVVNVIDDTTDTVLEAAIHTSTPDADINAADWTTVSSVAITGGQPVRLEWRFTGNNDGTYIGAYIDDVIVTVAP